MKALCLKEKNIFVANLPSPTADDSNSLVKVQMAGICNTDLELIKGYMGFEGVLGHEFVGTVEEASDKNWVGKRVCGEINFGCEKCSYCNRGLGRHCPHRTVLGILNQNGAMAEWVSIPARNLREVPETVTDHQAVFVEPLAAAFEILEQVKIQPNDHVAVVGDGKLGLLICQVLKLTGCHLVLVGKHETKMGLAKSWGLQVVSKDELQEGEFDVVVEASGSPSGFNTARQLLRPRGTLVLKSTYAENLALNAAPIVVNEITIVGSRCGQFNPALRALENKLIDVEKLIHGTFPFGKVIDAFKEAEKPGVLKILLDFK